MGLSGVFSNLLHAYAARNRVTAAALPSTGMHLSHLKCAGTFDKALPSVRTYSEASGVIGNPCDNHLAVRRQGRKSGWPLSGDHAESLQSGFLAQGGSHPRGYDDRRRNAPAKCHEMLLGEILEHDILVPEASPREQTTKPGQKAMSAGGAYLSLPGGMPS